MFNSIYNCYLERHIIYIKTHIFMHSLLIGVFIKLEAMSNQTILSHHHSCLIIYGTMMK